MTNSMGQQLMITGSGNEGNITPPEHQHRGIGSALVNRIASDLSSQGIKVMEVKTLSADVDYAPYEKTRRFYEKVGFMHLDTIDPYPGWEPGSPCAIYIKRLSR